MSTEKCYVLAYAVSEGWIKNSFQTIATKKLNGKVLFNSRWRKLYSHGNLEYILVNDLKFSVVTPKY